MGCSALAGQGLAGECQPQPHPPLLGRVREVEDPLGLIGRQAAACITDRDPAHQAAFALGRAGFKGDARTQRRGLDGVHHHGHEHVLERRRVVIADQSFGGGVHGQGQLLGGHFGGDGIADVMQRGQNVVRPRRGGVPASDLRQPGDPAVQPIDVGNDLVHSLSKRLSSLRLAPGDLGHGSDAGQRIAQVMSQLGGELPDHGQPFAVEQLPAQGPQRFAGPVQGLGQGGHLPRAGQERLLGGFIPPQGLHLAIEPLHGVKQPAAKQ